MRTKVHWEQRHANKHVCEQTATAANKHSRLPLENEAALPIWLQLQLTDRKDHTRAEKTVACLDALADIAEEDLWYDSWPKIANGEESLNASFGRRFELSKSHLRCGLPHLCCFSKRIHTRSLQTHIAELDSIVKRRELPCLLFLSAFFCCA